MHLINDTKIEKEKRPELWNSDRLSFLIKIVVRILFINFLHNQHSSHIHHKKGVIEIFLKFIFLFFKANIKEAQTHICESAAMWL